MNINKQIFIYYITYFISVTFFLIIQMHSYYFFDVDLYSYVLSYYVFGGIIIVNCIKEKNVLSLVSVFNVYGLLYSNFFISQCIFNNIPLNNTEIEIMNMSYIGIISFNIAYMLSKKYNIVVLKKHNFILNYNKFKIYCWVLFLFSLFAEYYVVFLKMGFLEYLVASRGERTLFMEGYGVFSFYKSIFPILSSIGVYMYLMNKKISYVFLFLFSFIIAIMNAVVDGSRSEFISILLPIMLVVHYFKIIKDRNIIISIIGMFFLFGIWKSLYNDNIVLSYDSEFNTWYKIAANVLSDKTIDFFYGSTYLDTIYNFIIPVTGIESLSTWYVRTYEPSFYELGGGRGFSGILEAYLNWGYCGIVIVYAIYGFVIKQFQCKDILSVILYSIMLLSIHKFFRSEAFALWKTLLWMKVYPVVLIFYLSSKYKKV